MVYAIIDTNIIVSSFITKNPSSSTRRVINSMLSGKIKPLYNDEILAEYYVKKSQQPLNILDKVFTLNNSSKLDSIRLIRLLVKKLPRYSHADRPCILTVLMML